MSRLLREVSPHPFESHSAAPEVEAPPRGRQTKNTKRRPGKPTTPTPQSHWSPSATDSPNGLAPLPSSLAALSDQMCAEFDPPSRGDTCASRGGERTATAATNYRAASKRTSAACARRAGEVGRTDERPPGLQIGRDERGHVPGLARRLQWLHARGDLGGGRW